jgi:hypothetical protein
MKCRIAVLAQQNDTVWSSLLVVLTHCRSQFKRIASTQPQHTRNHSYDVTASKINHLCASMANQKRSTHRHPLQSLPAKELRHFAESCVATQTPRTASHNGNASLRNPHLNTRHVYLLYAGFLLGRFSTLRMEVIRSKPANPHLNTRHVYLLYAGFLLGWFSTLRMEVIRSFETSVRIRTKRCYIPEYGNIHGSEIWSSQHNLVSPFSDKIGEIICSSGLKDVCIANLLSGWALLEGPPVV